MKKLTSIPVLPLRDIVVFPHMVAPLFVGRQSSVKALNNVMTKDKKRKLINFRLPVQELNILERYCRKRSLTKTAVFRRFLETLPKR